MEQEKIMTIHCASCGAPAQYDIVKQNYHCPNCGEDTGTEESLPNYSATELASGTYPESPNHGNYGNNINLLWKCSGTKGGRG